MFLVICWRLHID